MIHLERVNKRTFETVLKMKTTAEQERYVAPNVESLAEAWLYYDNAFPFTVFNDSEPVGFLMLALDSEERTAGLWRLMIATEHQHKGYGRAAVEACIKLAADSGKYDIFYLDYVPENTVARNMYYSLGFRENGKVDEGEIIMTLPLTDVPKLGMCIADEDDFEDISTFVSNDEALASLKEALGSVKLAEKAIGEKFVKRLTLMGETVGIVYKGVCFLGGNHKKYAPEAAALINKPKP